MRQRYANNAKGKLNAGILAAATSLTLQAGQGAKFPDLDAGGFFMCRIVKTATGAIEVIKVTGHSGTSDTFSTIVRAQEDTASIDFDANDKLELTVTKGTLERLNRPDVEEITGDVTLDSGDFFTQKFVSASSVIQLPPAGDVDIGDIVAIKSMTTGEVRLVADGTETIDDSTDDYRLPSYCSVRVMAISSGGWALLDRPGVDVGDVVWWPVDSATPKLGYEFADEQAISRSTFAGLFAVYGTTHGAGNGTTTFNKVDMRGRTPIGRDNMGGNAANRLQTSTTITTTNASAAATVASGTGIARGMQIISANVPAGTTVLSISGVNVTMSANATATAGPVAARFSAIQDDPQDVGSAGGSMHMQQHDHGVNDPGHVHNRTFDLQSLSGGAAPNILVFPGSGVGSAGFNGTAATTGITLNDRGAGDSQNVQPGVVGNWLVKT